MCCQSFLPGFRQDHQAVFQSWDKGLSQVWVCLRFVSIKQGEGQNICGTVRDRVVMKLSSGKKVHSFLRIVGTEDMEICFNLLIGLLSLSISLRVVCGGELDIIVKELG